MSTSHALAAAAASMTSVLATAAAATGIVRNRLRSARAERDHARYEADHDALTGLPSRRYLLRRLAELSAGNDALGVAMIDLDRFKELNDRLGHDAGDALLRAVAGQLTAQPAPVDLAGRLQGDEFLLLILGGHRAALAAAELAHQAITGILRPDPHDPTAALSASVGLALANPPVAPETMLALADQAMYEAKATGGIATQSAVGPIPRPGPRPATRLRDRPQT